MKGSQVRLENFGLQIFQCSVPVSDKATHRGSRRLYFTNIQHGTIGKFTVFLAHAVPVRCALTWCLPQQVAIIVSPVRHISLKRLVETKCTSMRDHSSQTSFAQKWSKRAQIQTHRANEGGKNEEYSAPRPANPSPHAQVTWKCSTNCSVQHRTNKTKFTTNKIYIIVQHSVIEIENFTHEGWKCKKMCDKVNQPQQICAFRLYSYESFMVQLHCAFWSGAVTSWVSCEYTSLQLFPADASVVFALLRSKPGRLAANSKFTRCSSRVVVNFNFLLVVQRFFGVCIVNFMNYVHEFAVLKK